MRKILIEFDQHHIITYAYDGLVIVRSTDWLQEHALIMPHHRRFMGVGKAFVDPLRKYVISLGRDNTIVCTVLTKTVVDTEKESQLLEILESEEVKKMFENETVGFEPEGKKIFNFSK